MRCSAQRQRSGEPHPGHEEPALALPIVPLYRDANGANRLGCAPRRGTAHAEPRARMHRNWETHVKSMSIVMRSALLSAGLLALLPAPARAAELPSYFKEIVGTSATSAGEIANRNVLQLNTTMFELYGDAAQAFKKNILANHPVILGLFSGAGGQFILYRPG